MMESLCCGDEVYFKWVLRLRFCLCSFEDFSDLNFGGFPFKKAPSI